MPFSNVPYTWNQLLLIAPDGVYAHIESIVKEFWLVKEKGEFTRSGCRTTTVSEPPPGPIYPPVRLDNHHIQSWIQNGETKGSWVRWIPPPVM